MENNFFEFFENNNFVFFTRPRIIKTYLNDNGEEKKYYHLIKILVGKT